MPRSALSRRRAVARHPSLKLGMCLRLSACHIATVWDGPRMMARRLLLTFASATVVAIVAAFTWFDLTHLSMSECMDQEAKDYPHLEQVAQEVMGSVGDQTRRGSLCEEAVDPGAYVRVSVYDWTARKDARAYLREAGITVPNGEPVITSQGVRISYSSGIQEQENDGKRYVTVSFSVPR